MLFLKLQLKLNEPDDKDELPLDLALRSQQQSIAKNLVKNLCDLNKTDSLGLTLLHKAISRGTRFDLNPRFFFAIYISINIQIT